jgi:hypothetical protein
MDKKYIWAEDPRPVCVIPDGGFSSLSQIGNDCKIPQDYSGPLVSFSAKVVDKHGHILDGDNDPNGKHGCDHKETKEWKAEHRVHKKAEVAKELEQQQTIASVATQPAHLDIPKPPPEAEGLESMTMITGAVAGVVGSSLGPILTKLLKNYGMKFLKSRFKKPGSERAAEEDKGALDCKTHNMQCNTRSTQFSAKLQMLESRLSEKDSSSYNISNNSIEDLIERIEKLEKKAKR